MAESNVNASPTADDHDSLELAAAAEHAALSPVGEMVRDVLGLMNANGEDAEEAFQADLVKLRKYPVEAVIEIARQECACCAADYSKRWALVYACCCLEHRAALPLLKSVVLTPMSTCDIGDPHSSAIAQETIIRTTAVDGVAELARDGDEEPLAALWEFLHVPSFSIRRAAAQGLLSSPQGEDLRDRIAKCLPKEQRFIVELKKQDVRKAPQVADPRLHLSDAGKRDAKSTAPDLQDRASGPAAGAQFIRDAGRSAGDSSYGGQVDGTPKARDKDTTEE